jgi:DnaJ family protein A protein 2
MSAAAADDLYALLGVGRSASDEELKKAFRRAALETHPDKPGGSKEKFQAVNEAYQVLGNPQKRAEYDATGRVPMDGDGPDGGMGGGVDISEILGSLFGRGMAGGFGTPEGIPFPMFGGMGGGHGMGKAPRGPNKVHEIGVSLADLWAGKTFTLNMKRDVLCGDCSGAGGTRMEACGGCSGRGFRLRRQQMGPMVVASQEPCGECRGAGQKAADRCAGCEGRRVVGRDSVLDGRIEPGMQEGDRLVFPGQCSESPDFEAPGDVVLVLRSATGDPAASTWIRRGADLMCEVRLGLAESLLGWERQMEGHPSGRPLEIIWTEGALRDGEVLRVPGWGMPVRGSPGKYGDLRLVCRVDRMEGSWSEEQRRALQAVWPEWKAPTAKEGMCVPQRVLS